MTKKEAICSMAKRLSCPQTKSSSQYAPLPTAWLAIQCCYNLRGSILGLMRHALYSQFTNFLTCFAVEFRSLAPSSFSLSQVE